MAVRPDAQEPESLRSADGSAGAVAVPEALLELEARYRHLVEMSPDAVLVHWDGRILYGNSAARHLLAVPAQDELVSQPISRLLELVGPKRLDETLKDLYRRQPVVRGKAYWMRRWDGEELHLEISSAPVSWKGGPARQSLLRDVTQRQKDHEELRHRKEQLHLAFSGSLGGLWDVHFDPDKGVGGPVEIDVSPELKRLLGFAPDDRIESVREWRQHVILADRPRFDQVLSEVVAGKRDKHELDYRFCGPDRRVHWLHTRGRLYRDAQGRPVRWIGVDWDVTESREALEALRRSEEQFTTLFRMSPALLAVITIQDGRLQEVNESFLSHLGFERDEVQGVPVQDLGLFEQPEVWQRLVAEAKHRRPFRGIEVRLRARTGEIRLVQVSGECIDLNGRPCLAIAGHDISNQVAMEERLRQLAYFDPLTRLPNRALCERHLAEALERGRREDRRVGVLFVDLDRFKMINDSLGHGAGDELLVAAAQRFTASLRPNDLLARFGGDEFVVVLEGLQGEQEAAAVAGRLLASLQEPVEVADTAIHPSASVGVAVSGHDTAASDLLRYADAAMYRAKTRGGATFELFDGRIDGLNIARLRLEGELRQALDRSELEVYYQPVVRLADGGLVGVEALVRWNHPQRGLVAPAEFIPAAEESGLIGALGDRVLRDAAGRWSRWSAAGWIGPDFRVSVNLSARQLHDHRLVERMRDLLEEHAIPTGQLQLEITENVLLQRPDTLVALRELGLRVALDDFGTGYASLAYLKDLRIDELKIDRSFVRDLLGDRTTRFLVQAIVDLARALGVDVTAEGIETEDQARCLRQIGCSLGQGFLFDAPLPHGELESRWLQPAE